MSCDEEIKQALLELFNEAEQQVNHAIDGFRRLSPTQLHDSTLDRLRSTLNKVCTAFEEIIQVTRCIVDGKEQTLFDVCRTRGSILGREMWLKAFIVNREAESAVHNNIAVASA